MAALPQIRLGKANMKTLMRILKEKISGICFVMMGRLNTACDVAHSGSAALSPAHRAVTANRRLSMTRMARRGEDIWTAPAERSGDGAFGWMKKFYRANTCLRSKAAWRCASRRSPKRTALLFASVCMFAVAAPAATVLSGNVSGTWTTNGSPYILSADCTVASNQTLNIEPGVEVIIEQYKSLRVDGGIAAVGTPEALITIHGTSTSNLWGTIVVLPKNPTSG